MPHTLQCLRWQNKLRTYIHIYRNRELNTIADVIEASIGLNTFISTIMYVLGAHISLKIPTLGLRSSTEPKFATPFQTEPSRLSLSPREGSRRGSVRRAYMSRDMHCCNACNICLFSNVEPFQFDDGMQYRAYSENSRCVSVCATARCGLHHDS